MRALVVLSLLLVCRSASAQDAATPPEAPAPEAPTEASPAAPGESGAPESAPTSEDDLALRAPAPDAALQPKVALILVGDPDERAVAALEALSLQLDGSDAVRLPSDPVLRRAFTGRGTDDGLDDVRSARRALGLSERRDIPVLARLGRLATASAVVVVRAAGAGHEALVLDVNRGAFFDGTLSLPASEADARAFIGRRARAAARATETSSETPAAETAAPTEATETTEASAVAAAVATATEAGAAEGPAPAGDPVLLWFEQNWAYLAAGALLAGGIAFVAVVATDSGGPQPMLRFVPGEL